MLGPLFAKISVTIAMCHFYLQPLSITWMKFCSIIENVSIVRKDKAYFENGGILILRFLYKKIGLPIHP